MSEQDTEDEVAENIHDSNGLQDIEQLKRSDYYLKQFINNYKRLPVLWDTTNKYYRHKFKRAKAIEKLTSVYRFIKPNATQEDTKKKINTLRSNYKRELNKIVQSHNEGENEYTPTSRVFYMLKFLNKCEEQSIYDFQATSQQSETDDNSYIQICEDSLTQTDSSSNTCLSSTPQKKRITVKNKSKAIKECAIDMYAATNQPGEINVNPTALYWSQKLENLEREQKHFAEKAINDILFEAELGLLNRNSVQINSSHVKNEF